MRFLTILGYVLAIPLSFAIPTRFISWFFMKVEYKFVPFRWRECNYNLLLLPLAWFFPWLAFWICWFTR